MPGSFVVVRLPASGTLVGQTVAKHPGSRFSCVSAGTHDHAGKRMADHVALVEGVPDFDMANLLLAWQKRHGESPQVLGGLFALRLPVDLAGDHTEVEAACIRLGATLPDPCQLVTADGLEVWCRFASAEEAERGLARLKPMLQAMPTLWAGTAQPSEDDVAAWNVLRQAATGLVPDCLLAAS